MRTSRFVYFAMRWRSSADPRDARERPEKSSKLQLCYDDAGKKRKLATAKRLALVPVWNPHLGRAVK